MGVALFIAGVAIAGVALGCGGGDSGGGVGPDGNVHQGVGVSGTMTVSPASLTLVQGQSATATLTLSLKGSSPGTITFGMSAASGITASFNPASLTGSGSTTVTLAVASDAPIINQSGASVYFVGFVGTDTLVLDAVSTQINYTIRNARPGVAVTRAGSGSGTVTSSPAGINCGVTGGSCSAVFDLGPITLTAAPAAGSAFTSWSGLCTGTAATCTFTPNDFGNTVTATFTSTTPAIGLSVSPSPASVQAGATTAATMTLTRINGFASPVALSVNAPTGLAVSANPASVTGTTSTLTISAAASLAAGSYPVTITGTGTGVTQQSVTFPVQVAPGSSGGSIAFNFANCEANQIPIWFAVQSGTGSWTRVTPSNNVFTFTLGATGAYALVTRDGTDTTTTVTYASAAEIAQIAGASPCGADPPTGTKHLTGTFNNFGSDSLRILTVVVGGASYTKPPGPTSSFGLANVPSGPRDLIAAKIQSNALGQSRMIVRRNTNYSNNQNIPILDFGISIAEAFSPPIGVMTPLNLGGDQIEVDASLLTSNGLSTSYFTSNFLGPAGYTAYAGLPDTLLRPGDLHLVTIFAAPGGGTDFRLVGLQTHSVNVAQATPISFGPPVAGVAVTNLAAAPYLRLRGQVSSQSAYTAGGVAEFDQGGKHVSLGMTAAYLGSAPATWMLDIPDLSGAGY
ncbi:MAG: hypothetical protein ACREPM_08125, partial [Gemmatimonadaceae bacterium]